MESGPWALLQAWVLYLSVQTGRLWRLWRFAGAEGLVRGGEEWEW